MTAAEKWDLISPADYLAGETEADSKHEFIDGVVHAMAGGNVRHSAIASNILGALHGRLRGTPCRPFNSDILIRIKRAEGTRFYYPDVSVVCESNPPQDPFQDRPVLIFEVLSDSTRRIDEGEKKDAYLSIPSLYLYAAVEPETRRVVTYRRTVEGVSRDIFLKAEDVVPLGDLKIELPLAEIYEGIEFD